MAAGFPKDSAQWLRYTLVAVCGLVTICRMRENNRDVGQGQLSSRSLRAPCRVIKFPARLPSQRQVTRTKATQKQTKGDPDKPWWVTDEQWDYWKNETPEQYLENFNDEPVKVHWDDFINRGTSGYKLLKEEAPGVLEDIKIQRYEGTNEAGSVRYSLDGNLKPVSIQINPDLIGMSPEEVSKEITEAYNNVYSEGSLRSSEIYGGLMKKYNDIAFPDDTFNG
ncbi:hypothetical protein AAMO2058_000110700 [Amorphochlora amoebiformis]